MTEDTRLTRAITIFPNLILGVCNILVGALAVLGLFVGIVIFWEAETDFLFNARLAVDPKPCGLATPDVFLLTQGLGIEDTTPNVRPRRNTRCRRTLLLCACLRFFAPLCRTLPLYALYSLLSALSAPQYQQAEKAAVQADGRAGQPRGAGHSEQETPRLARADRGA